MRDVFTETVVSVNPQMKDLILKWIFVVFTAAFVFLGLFAGMIFLIPAILFAYLAYRAYEREDREYEYSHTNDVFDIDMVIRSSKRKHLLTVKLQDVQLVASSDAPEASRFRTGKTCDFTAGPESENVYVMICSQSGNSTKILFQPSQAMLKGLKQWIPSKVFI